METDQPGLPSRATVRAGRGDRRAALVIALVSLLVLVVVAPGVSQQWAAAPAFIPAYQAAVAINDLVTAALLFAQFRELGRPSLRLLGAGYLYTACIVVAHTISFPGLFGPAGLVGGPQTTVWLWLAWHVPFPLLVTWHAFLADGAGAGLAGAGRARGALVLAVVSAAAVIGVATAGERWLPALLDGNGYIAGVTRPVLFVPFALTMVALFALVIRTRLRDSLDIWLCVAMGAWGVEILLSAVLNSGRFQAGFYVGRLYGLLASSALLVSLLLATSALHGRLARAMGRERDAARAALDETEVRYRSLFDSIDAGFCIVEVAFDDAGTATDYRFVEVNPAFERQSGLVDATGKWIRALAPGHEQRWFDVFGRVASTGEAVRFEEHAMALGRWFDVHAFRTGEPGTGLVAILFNDVSARRRAEDAVLASGAALRRLNEGLEARVSEEVAAREVAQARLAHAQRMEALGQLAGGIAHDFNNVMQAVQGGAGLIRKRASDAVAVGHLAEMVEQAVERGASVTRRLLAFARRDDLRAEALDLPELVRGLQEVLEHTLGAGIAVRTEAMGPLPPVLADKGQLETVLVNLAANARDAMPRGGVLTVSVEAERVEAGWVEAGRVEAGEVVAPGLVAGSYLRLEVRDTGEGMAAHVLARASEPFFTTKSVGRGTGLGLAMARGFAEQSGGGFGLRSLMGAGTTVTLWLPLAQGAAEGAGVAAGGRWQAGRALRVLVVDDDRLVRQLVAEGLEERGFGTLPAGSAEGALALLAGGERPDVLLTDFAMPETDGLTLILEARRLRPGLRALLLTGNAGGEIEARLAAEGLVEGEVVLLRKPVGADVLAERIARLVQGAEQAGG